MLISQTYRALPRRQARAKCFAHLLPFNPHHDFSEEVSVIAPVVQVGKLES